MFTSKPNFQFELDIKDYFLDADIVRDYARSIRCYSSHTHSESGSVMTSVVFPIGIAILGELKGLSFPVTSLIRSNIQTLEPIYLLYCYVPSIIVL